MYVKPANSVKSDALVDCYTERAKYEQNNDFEQNKQILCKSRRNYFTKENKVSRFPEGLFMF